MEFEVGLFFFFLFFCGWLVLKKGLFWVVSSDSNYLNVFTEAWHSSLVWGFFFPLREVWCVYPLWFLHCVDTVCSLSGDSDRPLLLLLVISISSSIRFSTAEFWTHVHFQLSTNQRADLASCERRIGTTSWITLPSSGWMASLFSFRKVRSHETVLRCSCQDFLKQSTKQRGLEEVRQLLLAGCISWLLM